MTVRVPDAALDYVAGLYANWQLDIRCQRIKGTKPSGNAWFLRYTDGMNILISWVESAGKMDRARACRYVEKLMKEFVERPHIQARINTEIKKD